MPIYVQVSVFAYERNYVAYRLRFFAFYDYVYVMFCLCLSVCYRVKK